MMCHIFLCKPSLEWCKSTLISMSLIFMNQLWVPHFIISVVHVIDLSE